MINLLIFIIFYKNLQNYFKKINDKLFYTIIKFNYLYATIFDFYPYSVFVKKIMFLKYEYSVH